jgi:hypothetical protein
MSRGVGKILSHIRGFIFGCLALLCVAIGFAIMEGWFSSSTNASNIVEATAPESATKMSMTAPAVASPEIEKQLARMSKENKIDLIEEQLSERRIDVLKVIPALHGKSNVAAVLKARRIRIGYNATAYCDVYVKLSKAPGCLISIFITRNPLDEQTDLSGVHAHWFKGLADAQFLPLDGWAKHVNDDDELLAQGGLLEQADVR